MGEATKANQEIPQPRLEKESEHWLEKAILAAKQVEDGMEEDAVDLYEQAISLNPDKAWPYVKLAELVDPERQLELYEKAIQVEATNPWGYIGLVKLLKEKDRAEVALEKCNESLTFNPGVEPLEILQLELERLLLEKQLDRWLERKSSTQENQSKEERLHFFESGISGEQTGNWLDPALAAEEQLKRGKSEEATALYEQAIRFNPDRAWPYLKLADLYKVKGRILEAIELCREAVLLEPKEKWAYVGLADALKENGQVESAIKLYFWSVLSDPKEVWKKVYQDLSHLAKHERISKFISENKESLRQQAKSLTIGLFEICVGNAIKGWAFRWEDLEESIKVVLLIDHQKVGTVRCNQFNKNLKKIGLGKGNYGFEFIIPDQYLDGKEHLIELQTVENQSTIAEDTFKFQVQGNIDQIDSSKIVGWIADQNSPENSLDLDIYINGYKYQSVTANSYRDDVGAVIGFSYLGFFVPLKQDRLRGAEVVLTLKGSHLPILDTPKIVLDREAKVNTLSLLNQKISDFTFLTDGEKQWLTKVLFPNLKTLARHQIEDEQQLLNHKKYNQLAWWEPKEEAPVNVIVPVYRNLKVTKECLERVIRCKRHRPYQITVVNDCSPEPEIHIYLDELAATGAINLIKHEVNRGFPTSVNDGMMSDTTSDVVLLNSDAYVTDYWLDRLRESVYKEDKVATGTAFSNNATIFSYPINCQEIEDIPPDLTLEELAEIFYKVNKNNIIKVPSGHGFCLYIRRDALKEVGYFDAETWGKGYGEEVDWCQKALDLGWRHVAATGVFVQHVGSQSFVGDKTDLLNNSLRLMREKYPEYDLVIREFISSDPFAKVRRNVDLERLKRCGNRFILMINHNLGGGTEKHFQDLARLLELEQINVLVLKPDSQSSDWVELTSPKFKSDLLARYHAFEDFKALLEDLKSLGVFHIHVHHTIGFEDDLIDKLLQGLELSYDVTLHDYTSVCPRVTLSQSEGKYCQEPPVEVCELCIKQHGVHNSLEKRYQKIGSVKKWRSRSHKFLQGARKVFVPSQDMSNRMLKHFPEFEFTVRPHPEQTLKVTLHSQNQNESTVRVGLIGGISSVKGLKTLHDCATYAEHLEKDIEFVVIGTTADNDRFGNLQNVTIYGSYQPENLQELINNSHLDFVAFFSTWPETYCYTLSEALECGLYPFAFDIGSVGDRIRNLGVGHLINLEADISTLVEKLQDFGYQCRQQQDTIEVGYSYADSFVSRYYCGFTPAKLPGGD